MPSYSEVLALPNRPKIGVVLSSGGIKPFAAIELFDFLEQAKIPIDLLIGSSGGAIAAVMKAMGQTIPEMRQSVQRFIKPELFHTDYNTIGSLLHLPFTSFGKGQGILQGSYFSQSIHEFVGNRRIEDLSIKTILQVTDIDTGLGVAMSEGDVATVMRASSALLPFLPPVEINGHWYADASFSDSMPVLQAVAGEMDIIIAMDFQSAVKHNGPKNYFEHFDRFNMQCIANLVHHNNLCAVEVHHYEIIFVEVAFDAEIQMWETSAIPIIAKQGAKAVEGVKEQIIKAIELFPCLVL